MARQSKNVVKDEAGNLILPTTADNCEAYVNGWVALPESDKAGYDKYFGNNGFVKPSVVRKLNPNTIGFLLLGLLYAAEENGSADMKNVLNTVDEFRKTKLPDMVKKIKVAEAQKQIAAIAAGAGLKQLTIDNIENVNENEPENEPEADPTENEPVAT